MNMYMNDVSLSSCYFSCLLRFVWQWITLVTAAIRRRVAVLVIIDKIMKGQTHSDLPSDIVSKCCQSPTICAKVFIGFQLYSDIRAMFTHDQTNGNMLLNEPVDHSLFSHWNNFNNLNPHSILPAPKDTIRPNGFFRIHPGAHPGKGTVTHLDNFCSSMGKPDSLTGIKYPRIFRPIILQQHPEYSSRMLPQIHDRHPTILQDREPLISNDREKKEIPNFVYNLGSDEKLKKQDEEKFCKRVFQFHFSISESVKGNKFSNHSDSEMTSQLTLNNSEENLPPVYNALKPTKLDLPYVSEISQQTVNRQDRWDFFPNPPFNSRNNEIDNIYFKGQICPFGNLNTHEDIIPNWQPQTKQTIALHDRNDRIQSYAGMTNWMDSFSVNRFNPISNMNNPASNKQLSKRSEFWKQMNSLDNLENSFGNIHNIENPALSAVLGTGNTSGSYYMPPQKREMPKTLMCPYCNRTNSSQAQLKIHLRIHTGMYVPFLDYFVLHFNLFKMTLLNQELSYQCWCS